jgi:hypothetical protein
MSDSWLDKIFEEKMYGGLSREQEAAARKLSGSLTVRPIRSIAEADVDVDARPVDVRPVDVRPAVSPVDARSVTFSPEFKLVDDFGGVAEFKESDDVTPEVKANRLLNNLLGNNENVNLIRQLLSTNNSLAQKEFMYVRNYTTRIDGQQDEDISHFYTDRLIDILNRFKTIINSGKPLKDFAQVVLELEPLASGRLTKGGDAMSLLNELFVFDKNGYLSILYCVNNLILK